jgi:hypothetical protein
MSKHTITALFLLLLFIPFPAAAQQQAAIDYFPLPMADSVFLLEIFDKEGEILSTHESEATEQVEFEVMNLPSVITYYIYPVNSNQEDAELFRRAYSTAEDSPEAEITTAPFFLVLEVLDEFGIELPEFSPLAIDTGLQPGDALTTIEESFTVTLPDTLLDLIDLPAGVTVNEELDVDVTLVFSRLDDEIMSVPWGEVLTAGFKQGLSLDITAKLNVPIIGQVPITFNLLEGYGPVLRFADGKGLIYEEIEPVVIALRYESQVFEINEELAELNGTRMMKTDFNLQSDSSVDTDAEIPAVLSLLPNYPNPFNPSTTIVFELNEQAEITLEIFDIQGRRADLVTAGSRSPGQHHLPYDASALASGVYLYRLTASPQTHSGTSVVRTSSFTVLK